MPTTKLDLYKLHKDEYVTPKLPVMVKARRGKYLTIDGQGEPGSKAFSDRLGALYAVAYTLKMHKKLEDSDYKVCGLEALWWGENGDGNLLLEPRQTWRWKLIIRTPDFITAKDVKAVATELLAKDKPAEVAEVRLENIGEGACVQALHVGPYAAEPETIARMMTFASQHRYEPHGRHHEIYLSDPRRVPPERLRTILRIPVRKAA